MLKNTRNGMRHAESNKASADVRLYEVDDKRYAVFADDDGLNDAVCFDGCGEFGQMCFVEFGPRLMGVGLD